MIILWSPRAQSDRDKAIDYLESESPAAAFLVDERIEKRLVMLPVFPDLGRPGRVRGTRELVLQGTPYIAAYRVEGDVITILRLIHTSQRWPRRM